MISSCSKRFFIDPHWRISFFIYSEPTCNKTLKFERKRARAPYDWENKFSLRGKCVNIVKFKRETKRGVSHVPRKRDLRTWSWQNLTEFEIKFRLQIAFNVEEQLRKELEEPSNLEFKVNIQARLRWLTELAASVEVLECCYNWKVFWSLTLITLWRHSFSHLFQ